MADGPSALMSDYDADILQWSERQANLLRRAASGERVDDLDWPNIIEEVESVGRGQLSAVRSLLIQALALDLKAAGWPTSRDVPHWRAEARRLRIDAAEACAPSMRQRIDLDRLYARARSILPETIDGQAALPLPAQCPVTLDELLAEG
jgi:hypothetical protein